MSAMHTAARDCGWSDLLTLGESPEHLPTPDTGVFKPLLYGMYHQGEERVIAPQLMLLPAPQRGRMEVVTCVQRVL